MPVSVHGRRPPGAGGPCRLGKGRALIQDRLKLALGRAAFAADLDLPGTLHARLAVSPYAAARLVSADLAAARALPGVAVLMTAVDEDAKALLDPVARFAGSPWAVAVAEDKELAERAAEAIAFHAAPEPSRFDTIGAPVAARLERQEGDVEDAFGRADQMVEGTWRWPFAEGMALEPPTTLAWLDEDGRLVVRATTGAPFALRARIASTLGLPVSDLRVVRPQVGAPFGHRADPSGAPLAAALAVRIGRPVLLVERTAAGEPPPEAAHLVRLRAGLLEDRLLAVSGEVVLNLGADGNGAAALDDAALALRRCGVPFRLEARAVLTSLRPLSDARRTAGWIVRHALEGALDTGARGGGRDPLAVRARSARGDLRDAFARLASAASGTAPPPLLRHGLGVAVAGPWSLPASTASASVTRNQDGSLALRLGALGAPAGVGDALVARAAAVLGTDAPRVSWLPTDTDSAPAEDDHLAEPRLLVRAVAKAAGGLPPWPAGGERPSGAPTTVEASVTMEAEDLPAWTAVVLAEVEMDPETGLARPCRLLVAPASGAPSPLAAWEEGQLAAALPLVFGGADVAAAPDIPKVERVVPPAGEPEAVPPLGDLLPAAVAAFAHALRDASGVDVRELPVRPERLVRPEAPLSGR